MPTTKNETPAPRLAGVIVTHGPLAEALRAAAGQVVGDVRALEAVSNEGCSLETMTTKVRAAIERLGTTGTIVFVDSRGSSCATSSFGALQDLPNVRIIAGVNLPMLVDFLLRREDYDLDRMVERLLQRGRSSVQLLKGPGA